MNLILSALLLSFAYAQELPKVNLYGCMDGRQDKFQEFTYIRNQIFIPHYGDEQFECLKEFGHRHADCVGANSNNICTKADVPNAVADTAGLSSYAQSVEMTKHWVEAANCTRYRARCIEMAIQMGEGRCAAFGSPLHGALFGYMNNVKSCMNNLADTYIKQAQTPLKISRLTQSKEYNQRIECRTAPPGFRRCKVVVDYTRAENFVASGSDPGDTPDAPDMNGGGTPGPVLIPEVTVSALPPSAAAARALRQLGMDSSPPRSSEQCSGTMLGDGVTVVTESGCQLVQTTGLLKLQSTDKNGKKVESPATCDVSQASARGESMVCKLDKAQDAAPVYALKVDNNLKKCDREGWTVTCPEKAITRSLQKRVKIMGVAGEMYNPPEEGYAHFDRRTGQIHYATADGVVTNGVMIDFGGKTVIAHSRAPAAVEAMGSVYAVDRFATVNSKVNSVSPELSAGGAPLMREIELGDGAAGAR